MIAVIDETTPESQGGVFYVVNAGIVIEDPDEARVVLRKVIDASGRTRPFHWHKEGPAARDAMCEAIEQLGVVSHVGVGHPTARHGQEKARAVALGLVLPRLLADGVVEVLIEHRTDRQDQRDQAVILDVLHAQGRAGSLAYRWVSKTEPLVWIADALGGVMFDYLLGRDVFGRYDRLVASRCLSEPIYFRP